MLLATAWPGANLLGELAVVDAEHRVLLVLAERCALLDLAERSALLDAAERGALRAAAHLCKPGGAARALASGGVRFSLRSARAEQHASGRARPDGRPRGVTPWYCRILDQACCENPAPRAGRRAP